jgi:hypothetical protein
MPSTIQTTPTTQPSAGTFSSERETRVEPSSRQPETARAETPKAARLSAKGCAGAIGLLWGGGILVVALANMAFPNYGSECLRLMASVYPGFDHTRTIGDTLVGAGYGLVDGAVAGALFAWLYNAFAGRARA